MTNGSLQENGEVDESSDRLMKVRGDYELPRSDAELVAGGDPVKQFLIEHAEELRIPAAPALAEMHSATTPLGRVVRYQQQLDGLPVLDTQILVATNAAQDRIVQIDLDREPELEVTPAGDAPVTAEQAQQAALEDVGRPELRTEPPPPTQAYFPGDGGLHRVFVVLLPTQNPPHDWRIMVDAATGDVLDRQDLIKHVDGSGMVFDPNPIVTARDAALRDPDATAGGCSFTGSARSTIDAQRVTRPLRGITFDAATGRHRLAGPFVAIKNFGPPSTVLPEEANAHAFTYSSSDARFEAVNVYYAIDTFQRYLQDPTQGPGITTARNSQISCDPHEGSGAAFYSPLDKGLHFSNSGPCRPDRAEDAHVMIHEYGHAIQDDQVPGWGAPNPITGRRETRAMGEGYGDMAACIYFAEHGFLREVFEPWIFGDLAGLRRVDGMKVYPRDWADEEHADGEIWSAALWNVYLAIGGESTVPAERLAARDAVIKTVTLSHHLLVASSSMPDGAESVMRTNAALPQYRGRHLTEMLISFHARGLLVVDPAADLQLGGASTTESSPDVWMRQSDDNGTTHQTPLPGQDNFCYARVRNVGTAGARAFVVTFTIQPVAGTGFTYPADFLPPLSAACGFALAPGASTIVKAAIPAASLPPTAAQGLLLASVYTPTDRAPAGSHAGEHENLAQRHLGPASAPSEAFRSVPTP
ncbi:M36 family metallopeptidase [Arthrobacter sp. ov118]|uniref:M36 family metallopeptidase n=1 Tax=Arthrobacter sp. ov118 TaxID=1761747 RepID=UPI0008E6D913|nr:M36 family metallopeptidase [Arthrobacter sp. ov118]SFT91828.1 Fungalysin metallopeptidase (M36) [Arthrobacter sp. ov118]